MQNIVCPYIISDKFGISDRSPFQKDMITDNVFSPEGRVKRASSLTSALIFCFSVFLGLGTVYASSSYLYSNLTPYQRLCYSQYRDSFFRQLISSRKEFSYKLLSYTLTDPKTRKQSEHLWLEKDMSYQLDESGNIKIKPNGFPDILGRKDSVAMQGTSYFSSKMRNNAEVYKILKELVYDKTDYYEFLYLPSGAGLLGFSAFLLIGRSAHHGKIRRKLEGIFRRGMQQFTVKEYARRSRRADGFYLLTRFPNDSLNWRSRAWEWIKERIFPGANIYKLRVPREAESKGTLILGDTGSGKSVLINQILDCARSDERREPGVCYDPASEFVQYHFEEDKDFIINPLDERFPNWQLRDEIRSMTDLDLIAESFFPSKFIRDNQSGFFNKAAQDVFKLILQQKPTNEEIVKIICNPELIDQIVKGTEIAHKIDPKAGSQRIAVLASLADVGKTLRLIPAPQAGKKNFSVTGWTSGEKRSNWLFFTTTSDTRDSLKSFYSAMMNILMRRLMSIPQAMRQNNESWWFIADELHTLHGLFTLPEFAAECRKHGARPVFGTQTKHQIIALYGEEGRGFMAQAKLKIFYRCNEPDAAKWISDFIGSQELNKTQVSASVPTRDSSGRDSISFQNVTENKPLLIKEQIMGLDDLHGVWRLNKDIVYFKIQYIERQKRHLDFIPRKSMQQFNSPPVSFTGTVVQKPSAGSKPNKPASTNNKNVNISTSVDNPVSTDPANQQSNQEPPKWYSSGIRLDF